MNQITKVLIALIGTMVLGYSDSPAQERDWRSELPDEVRARLDLDKAKLLAMLGYDLSPDAPATEKPASMKVLGIKATNFDDDDEKDWQIHITTIDAGGRRIQGTLIYDLCEEGWECVASLKGAFPVGWGERVEGRLGIWTREPAPEIGAGADRIRYYRFKRGEYTEDRVEIESGG